MSGGSTHCANTIFFFLEKKIFLRVACIYLKVSVSEKEGESDIDIPSAGSLLKWPKWLELGRSEAGNF